MNDLISYTINGALTGLLYSLVAMGFVVIYRASRVFNFAQGEFVVIGAFLVWWFTLDFGLPVYVGVPIAIVASAAVGLVIERLFFRRLIGESVFSMVMVTIALLIFLRGIVLLMWGPQVRPFPAIFPAQNIIIMDDVFIQQPLLWGGVLTIILAIAMGYFFTRTRRGLMMSAVAEDHQIALSMGISVRRSVALAWMMGAVLSTVGAMVFLSGKSLTFLASDIGLAALPVALLAGVESVTGLIPAGLIVGIASGLAALYLDPIIGGSVSTVMPYLIMLMILFIRPTGLFGWKTIERV
ncbi:branched-chain amino acid ABC transporter permease [Nitriliruptoraceae bacterium ZYF776]|nr:branched-chain amino acid ABC transporter permease [Profundirhabdus halotolerans]